MLSFGRGTSTNELSKDEFIINNSTTLNLAIQSSGEESIPITMEKKIRFLKKNTEEEYGRCTAVEPYVFGKLSILSPKDTTILNEKNGTYYIQTKGLCNTIKCKIPLEKVKEIRACNNTPPQTSERKIIVFFRIVVRQERTAWFSVSSNRSRDKAVKMNAERTAPQIQIDGFSPITSFASPVEIVSYDRGTSREAPSGVFEEFEPNISPFLRLVQMDEGPIVSSAPNKRKREADDEPSHFAPPLKNNFSESEYLFSQVKENLSQHDDNTMAIYLLDKYLNVKLGIRNTRTVLHSIITKDEQANKSLSIIYSSRDSGTIESLVHLASLCARYPSCHYFPSNQKTEDMSDAILNAAKNLAAVSNSTKLLLQIMYTKAETCFVAKDYANGLARCNECIKDATILLRSEKKKLQEQKEYYTSKENLAAALNLKGILLQRTNIINEDAQKDMIDRSLTTLKEVYDLKVRSYRMRYKHNEYSIELAQSIHNVNVTKYLMGKLRQRVQTIADEEWQEQIKNVDWCLFVIERAHLEENHSLKLMAEHMRQRMLFELGLASAEEVEKAKKAVDNACSRVSDQK